MNIFRSYKRTRFFLWINIVGLAVGLASAITLFLFVMNELSYDKHFKDSDRIISLNSVFGNTGDVKQYPIATRRALTDIPQKVSGVESVTQIYNLQTLDFRSGNNTFVNVPSIMTEASFFDVFNCDFIEGDKDVLDVPESVIISQKYANILFGGTTNVVGKLIEIGDLQYTIGGVIKDVPLNTHFQFDLVVAMDHDTKQYSSLEFYTFYKIKQEAPLALTCENIEKEYGTMLTDFMVGSPERPYGVTEKLTDIYLNTKSTTTLGKRSSMSFVWLLSVIAVLILLLAITNFVNLFIAQGETRMLEIGIRKANGASIGDISRKFFAEIITIVLISFFIGYIILVICTPYFAELINRDIDLKQLYNPLFIGIIILLLIFTSLLSAIYPIAYLSKFNTIDILAKRIVYSKRRLTTITITFQAIISIIIISFILVVNNQISYLKKEPLGYNPQNVVVLGMNSNFYQNYNTIKQELEKNPIIKQVSISDHTFGAGYSGQGISLVNGEKKSINEYRVHSGLCEIMKLDLLEGAFYKEDDPNNANTIILNESAIKMLGLSYPVVGTTVDYKGLKEIRGVVKDFHYDKVENAVEPMVLRYIENGNSVYIEYLSNIPRNEVEQTIRSILSNLDSAYILNPTWLEDIYTAKFDTLEIQSRVFVLASILSIFISAIGLLAMHMLNVMRRKKEIGVRRVNGASFQSIFKLLSLDILKWILIAGIIAVPIVYYFGSDWLDNYSNHASLSWGIFFIPILLQCVITLIVTSGITMKVSLENPVNSLKSE